MGLGTWALNYWSLSGFVSMWEACIFSWRGFTLKIFHSYLPMCVFISTVSVYKESWDWFLLFIAGNCILLIEWFSLLIFFKVLFVWKWATEEGEMKMIQLLAHPSDGCNAVVGPVWSQEFHLGFLHGWWAETLKSLNPCFCQPSSRKLMGGVGGWTWN